MSDLDELTGKARALPAKERDQEIRAGVLVTKPADQVLKDAREQIRCSR